MIKKNMHNFQYKYNYKNRKINRYRNRNNRYKNNHKYIYKNNLNKSYKLHNMLKFPYKHNYYT